MSDVNGVSAPGGVGVPASSTTGAKPKAKPEAGASFADALKKVAGHSYARVTEGEKKGQYVNQSGNARDGDTFKLVKRDGFEYHVYGTGADRTIVRVPVKTDAAGA